MDRNGPAVRAIKIQVRPLEANPVGGNDSLENLQREYAQIVGVYNAAIREINARLQTLDSEFSYRHQHNPIHHIESRVKSLKKSG